MITPMEDEGTRLLPKKEDDDLSRRSGWRLFQRIPDHVSRIYVLFFLNLLTTFQCVFWYTFSSAPKPIRAYYGLSVAEIDQLLNWGPISFIPSAPLFAYLIYRPNGLRNALRLSALLCFTGCVLRVIPCWLSEETRKQSSTHVFLHVGQFLNGLAGAIVMNAPSRLSAIWFPPKYRGTATGIGYCGGNIGAALGFVLGPQLIQTEASRVPLLLYVTLGMSCVPMLMAILYCPDHPRVPVSQAIKVLEDEPQQTERTTLHNYCQSVLALLKNPHMVLLALIGGIEAGMCSAWGGLLQQVLDPPFSADFVGWLGVLSGLGSLCGNLLSGFAADRIFRRKLRLQLVLTFLLSGVAFAWFTFMFSNPFVDPIFSSAKGYVILSILLGGFFQGSGDPLFYELAAELTYPNPEGNSAMFITIMYNTATLVVLYAAPNMSITIINTLMSGTMFGCGILSLLIRASYARLDAESHLKLSEHKVQLE